MQTTKQPRFIGRKIPVKTLGITADYLPKSILEVIKKLTKAGFEAYIVGGGVRDELLGMQPKDFDAVTNAKPSEIKAVFGKRCRIIGRRFQLAHVYSGQDMIEVATFRAPPSKKSGVNTTGMVVRDNVWGSIDQDFARRDFSINALYYEPHKGFVYDFCDAVDDIQNKRLRFLGDTQVRIDEDPVRLLRALRFAAKLGLEMDDSIIQSFTTENWLHLQRVSPHRLYDETLKLFGGGYVTAALPLLFKYQAIRFLLAERLDSVTPLLQKVAENTDARINIGKSINPAFFYAALLWPAYQQKLQQYQQRMPLVEAMNKASIKTITAQRQITAMPRFAESFVRETWALQPRLISPKPKQITTIVELSRFRAAFDFLLLREQSGDTSTQGMGAWWQTFQTLTPNEQQTAIKSLQRKQLKQKRTPVALDDTPIAASNRANIHLPKEKTTMPTRRRPVRTAASKKSNEQANTIKQQVVQDKHLLADTIRGEKPLTHD